MYNAEIQTLVKKGLNFREIPAPNKNEVYVSIGKSLDAYINNISNQSKTPTHHFNLWKEGILSKVQDKLDKLGQYSYINVLAKRYNATLLKQLQEKWVFTPTDKASNNVTIVCKKHYMETLDSEIIHSGNFIRSNLTVDEVLNTQADFLDRFKINTSYKF